MASKDLTKVRILPSGMRLHEWISLEEGFFQEEGLEPEVMWEAFQQILGPLQGGTRDYKQRAQDMAFHNKEHMITNACMWGSVCNAGAGMGKFVPDVYGVARHAIFVRPESHIRKPEDLKDVPIAVAVMAGSHYNVPYRLEKYFSLEHVKIAKVGGFGARLTALLNKEVEASSLLDPQIYMAEELGLRKIIAGEFKTLWWVPEDYDPAVLRRYFTALDKAEQALTRNFKKYLPLWRKSISPEFSEREWRVESWGPGERFAFSPFPKEEYDEVMSAIDRWGMGVHMQDKNYDNIALPLRR